MQLVQFITMDERSYTNFDLVMEQAGEKYRLRVISSPAVEAAAELESLFSPLKVEDSFLHMVRPKGGMHRNDSTLTKIVRTFGAQLADGWIKLSHQARESPKKKMIVPEKPVSRSTTPRSFRETIKPRGKPGDLPS